AVATSGNTKRYIEHNGKRYGHILNPKTGWPIENAPRSVTVLANTCIEAGVLSSLAMLQGADAETFLSEEGVTFHLIH
ncbi:MAG: FAD:protein FMN transferase, partial [Gammaproteobacteria bacterium]|nr:FAD:protein FMN transferase [Gammaproteobacteria bacterium]